MGIAKFSFFIAFPAPALYMSSRTTIILHLSFCPSPWHCAWHKVGAKQRAIHKYINAAYVLFICMHIYVYRNYVMCIFF